MAHADIGGAWNRADYSLRYEAHAFVQLDWGRSVQQVLFSLLRGVFCGLFEAERWFRRSHQKA
jgi:hypothetical protein